MFVDHLTGSIIESQIFQFERNDVIQYCLESGSNKTAVIAKGDTLARIRSSELDRMYKELVGELQVAEMTLDLYRSGEKESVVEEARKKVDFERVQAEEQRRIVNRLQSLSNQSLISEEEYERAQNLMELYDIRVELAEAQLQTVSKGAHPDLIRSEEYRVAALRRQMNSLENRILSLNLVSPLTGVLIFYHNSDTLFSVRDTTQLCVLIPVQYSERSHIFNHLAIRIRVPYNHTVCTGKVARVLPEIQILNNKQVMLVSAEIDSINVDLVSGAIVRIEFESKPVSLLEYLRRLFGGVTFY